MKTVLRRIARVTAIVLSIGVALFWLHTCGHQDQYGLGDGQQGRTFCTFPGGITYMRWFHRGGNEEGLSRPRFQSFEYGADPVGFGNATYARPRHDWTNLGFAYEHEQWVYEWQRSGVGEGMAGRAITTGDPAYQAASNLLDERKYSVPFWPALALLAWVPARGALRKLRFLRRGRRRALKGLCPHCGYDLRAATDRCPECGAAVVIVRINAPGQGFD